eukprot:6496141-Pyramimonas_sp.AAC.1
MYRNVRPRREDPSQASSQPDSEPRPKRARHNFMHRWATPSMQSALCMLHASGEYTAHRDTMVRAAGARGRALSRRRPHRVMQSLQP